MVMMMVVVVVFIIIIFTFIIIIRSGWSLLALLIYKFICWDTNTPKEYD